MKSRRNQLAWHLKKTKHGKWIYADSERRELMSWVAMLVVTKKIFSRARLKNLTKFCKSLALLGFGTP